MTIIELTRMNALKEENRVLKQENERLRKLVEVKGVQTALLQALLLLNTGVIDSRRS